MASLEVHDKICVVTGAGSGLGFETAALLAAAGGVVALVCRGEAQTAAACGRMGARTGLGRIEGFACDLSSQRQVRALAERLRARFSHIDVLLHNAAAVYSERTSSEDGIEMQLAVNHLAPFLLTALLRRQLEAAPAARVVTVTSRAHARGTLHLEDLQLQHGYSAFRAYDQSKLANVLFTYELARRLAGTRVTANCIEPGLVRTGIGYKHTDRLSQLLWWGMTRLARSPERAAVAVAELAGAPEHAAVTGCYFSRGRSVPSTAASRDEELARALWRRSEELVGLAGDAQARTASGC